MISKSINLNELKYFKNMDSLFEAMKMKYKEVEVNVCDRVKLFESIKNFALYAFAIAITILSISLILFYVLNILFNDIFINSIGFVLAFIAVSIILYTLSILISNIGIWLTKVSKNKKCANIYNDMAETYSMLHTNVDKTEYVVLAIRFALYIR